MRYVKPLTLLFATLILSSCKQENKPNPATVYSGGDIITMVGNTPTYAEAVVVKNGRIEFAGTASEAMELAGKGHNMIDLQGKTMLPGFIDGHAHFSSFSTQAIGAQILPPPDAGGKRHPNTH